MLDQLQEGDVLVLAGSIPASMPDDIYRNILKRLDGKGILIAVDATGNLLVNVLEYHPFLVKPNNHELGEIFGAELKDRESVIPYAKKMQEMGATNVLVSMAGEGAVLAAADGKVYLAPAPKGKLVNGVGAGDSMVAGFLTGWLKRQDYREAFHMGIATGSAVLCVGLVIYQILSLMFSQTMFFLTDYIDIEAIQALKESVRIMRGKKGKLFYLQLSFIGIYLLGAIACGIGLLWVIPYMQVTMANFYRKITGEI